MACVAPRVAATLSTSRKTRAPRARIASWTSCCSRVSETSFARRAEVCTATSKQATATTAITPTGTIRRNRAWSQRDRPVSSAICARAEVITRPTLWRYCGRAFGGIPTRADLMMKKIAIRLRFGPARYCAVANPGIRRVS